MIFVVVLTHVLRPSEVRERPIRIITQRAVQVSCGGTLQSS